ncbi:MAG: hypothetical protein JWP31_2267 [Aeromicrobium sp.]|nr:hypothetical protein [Aeromicrobium sp.]
MTDPIEPTDETAQEHPGADEGQKDPVDPVQEGEPATGPEAPVPPTGSTDDA